MSRHTDVTQLLQSLERGESDARDLLLDLIHGELRALAGAQFVDERAGHTLQPTALVNEAYLRLVASPSNFQSRAHFFGAAAEAMRRILIDHARKRGAQKRGGGAARVTLDDFISTHDGEQLDPLALDEALTALEEHDSSLADLVRHRYCAGLTIEQTASLLEKSMATVKRGWNYARAWLFERMDQAGPCVQGS